jgi:hypothetical protein
VKDDVGNDIDDGPLPPPLLLLRKEYEVADDEDEEDGEEEEEEEVEAGLFFVGESIAWSSSPKSSS